MIEDNKEKFPPTSPPTSAKEVGGKKPSKGSDFEVILDRLKRATGAESDSDFARALSKSPQAIDAARTRNSIPSKWVTTISGKYEFSADWLWYGTGPMKRGGERGVAEEGAPLYKDTDAGMPSIRMIPKRKARLCAGTGSLTTDETIEGYYAFREEFLARKGNPSTMALVDVYGDSMSPEICDGDTVLVDESQREILAGRIYAVGMGEEVVIKELYKKPGKLLLISKNPAYGVEEIDLEDIDGLVRIVGRVLWWCREAR